MLKLATAVFVIALISGCATQPEMSSDSVSNRDKALTSVFAATDSLSLAEVGDLVTFENAKYTVLDDYTAASGRKCKRLHAMVNDQVRVGCRSNRDEWYLRKSLGETGKADSVAEPKSAFVKKAIEPDIRSVALQSNENLWRFSRRVTGNANNWQKIARYNDIDDVTTLGAGYRLKIPPDLPVPSNSD